ncbi:MAG: ubiquinol-cytochrome c reductase iron-sulfur subunit [bacterium]
MGAVDRERDPDRRRFLFGALGAIAAGIFAEVAGMVLAYVSPDRGGAAGGRVACGRVDDYSPGDVRLFPEAQLYVVRRDDGFLAFSQQCTHLGCLVPWDAAKGEFHCPCHGGVFDANGAVKSGPPPRPLDLVALEIADGALVADTSKLTMRKGWSADQVVKL